MDLQTLQEEFSAQGKQVLESTTPAFKVGRMSQDERLIDTIPAFRVTEEVSRVVRDIVKTDRRTISDVARALLERGVAAYQRDGLLFEPREDDGSKGNGESGSGGSEDPSAIPVRTITLGSKKERKNKTA